MDIVGFYPRDQTVKVSHRVGVTFYPTDDPVFSRSSKARDATWKTSAEATVVQFSWSKRLGAPNGSWSAVLKIVPGADFSPIGGDVVDGDWVDIEAIRNGEVFRICRGVVDSVREVKQTMGGATVTTVLVTGRDHGALFLAPVAWNNIFVETFGELAHGLNAQRLRGEPGGTPSQMFERMINATFGGGTSKNRSQWTLPTSLESEQGAKTFIDALDVVNDTPTRGFFANEQQIWAASGQNLHQTLQMWTNPLLNEIIYDTSSVETGGWPLRATIRERPFVTREDGINSPFFDLSNVEIPDWCVVESNVGRSGAERFNIFQITSSMQYLQRQEQIAVTPPKYSLHDISMRGVRPYVEETKYIVRGDWEAERARWQSTIVDWYAPNPYFLSGTLSVPFMLPEVRVGTTVTVRDVTYYVEGVDLSFAVGGDGTSHGTTDLTLTRGVKGDAKDRVAVVSSAVEKFSSKR